MLSPDSGCNRTFGTVKIEDTVDIMKSCHLYIYRRIYNLFFLKMDTEMQFWMSSTWNIMVCVGLWNVKWSQPYTHLHRFTHTYDRIVCLPLRITAQLMKTYFAVSLCHSLIH